MIDISHLLRDSEGQFKIAGVLGVLEERLEQKITQIQTQMRFAKPQFQMDATARRVFIAGYSATPNPVSFTILQYAGAPDSSIVAYGIGSAVEESVINIGDQMGMTS